MPDDMKSKIAELERQLTAKDFESPKIGDGMRAPAPQGIPESWDVARDTISFEEEKARLARRHQLMKKFALGSVGFFILAVAVAAFMWWRGTNIISSENIKVEVAAPPAVAGGEVFETKLLVANNNNVAIEKATLFLEYPSGFYAATDRTALPRIAKDLGQILPGQSIAESVTALVYGEENTSKEVRVTLEYRTAGSNATLKKETVYAVRISSSPVNLKFAIPREASSGQEVEFVLNVESNSLNTLDGLLVSAEYPFGFTYRSATPAPTYGANTWLISSLPAQEKQEIRVRGVLEGQEGEQKILRASIGARDTRDERIIGVIYNAVAETLAITKPVIGLDVVINSDRAAEIAAPFGKGIRVDVLWQSNSPVKVTDAVIEVKLKGDVLNRYSIYASNGGFYRSVDDTIVWQKPGVSELAILEPGAHGAVSFSFTPVAIGAAVGRMVKNPQIAIEVYASARRTSDLGAVETITTLATRTVKFESDLRLTAQGLYYSGPFKNTGPLPPKADSATTYTIKWTVRNTTSSVSDAIVQTTLPVTYVKWLGNISPSGEDVSYNESNAEVTWNVGRIPAGGTREAAFQISFLPSLSQLHQTPKLTEESVLTARDDFAKTMLGDTRPPITTHLSTDPAFSQNQATVVQ